MKEDIWTAPDFKGTGHEPAARKPFGQGLQTNQLKPEASMIPVPLENLDALAGDRCSSSWLSLHIPTAPEHT